MSLSRKLFATLSQIIACAALCYYPDGTASVHDIPCTTDANSTCCGQTYACLSNNICASTDATPYRADQTGYVRGSCTDKTFSSSNCPLFCHNPDYDDVSSGQRMQSCSNQPGDTYVCWGQQEDSDCSSQDDLLFFPGRPEVLTTVGVTATSDRSSTTSTRPSSIAPSSSANVSSNATGAASPESTVGSSSSSHIAIGVGVGVGVGCAVLIIVLVAYLLWRRNRSRKIAQASEDPVQSPPPLYRDNLSEVEAKERLGSHEMESPPPTHEMEDQYTPRFPAGEIHHELPG